MSPEDLLRFFRQIVEFLLPFVPHEQLAAELTAAGKAQADAIADVAEDVKFGPE